MKILNREKVPFCITIFVIIATLKSFAGDFHGCIYDKTNEKPIEYVNVILLKTDSTFFAGVVTDEKGNFLIKSVMNQNYILKISFLGYRTFLKNISIGDNSNQEIVRLEPSEVSLAGVVITSQQPIFKSMKGNLITNVSLSNLKNAGTAYDVLQRIPGIVLEDDKISVYGKGAPVIYINNRKINDHQELDRLLSENISTVELLTNPGAKYSADGRAVLIIKTKAKNEGLSALVSEKVLVGTKLGDSENINLSYSSNKVNVFSSYFHGYRNLKTDDHSVYSIIQDNGNTSKHDFRMIDRYPSNYQIFSSSLDWTASKNHSLGIEYQYTGNNASKATAENNNVSILNGQTPDTTLIETLTNDKFNRSLVNVFYNGTFGSHLSAQLNIDYLNNQTDRDARNSESSSSEVSEEDIISKSDYGLWAGKLILEHKSNIGTIGFGGEFSLINGNGSIISQTDESFDNSIYSSKEQKTSGFLSYTNIFGGYSLNAGLRYEYTKEKSKDDILNQNKVDRKYSEIYPNFSVSRKINEVQLSLLFSKKVSRPSITDLYNNTAYVNQYILQKGNPYLTKTDIYDVNLQAAFKMFYVNLGYSYLKDPIAFYSEPESNSDYIITTVANYDKYQDIEATLNFNHKISFWHPNYTFGLTKPFFSAIYLNNNIGYNKLSFSVRSFNDFSLPRKFILSANYTYDTNSQYYLIDIGQSQKLDLGIRKLFLEDKLKFNLEIQDIFNWMKQKNSLKINNLNLIQTKKRETRFVFLTISYQFNNDKKSYRGSHAAKDDIDRF
ncbi:MAG: hypothetical protein H6Q14_2996 [Bacteroidetes bacterium]|nr:hypothetical protein [Bacteroidota bacterium]